MNRLLVVAMAVGAVTMLGRPAVVAGSASSAGHPAHASWLSRLGVRLLGDSGSPAHTTWDSVYTADQATHGDSVYTTACVKCHLSTLLGNDDGAPLIGPDFASDFDGQTVKVLFETIRTSMPPDSPKTIPPDQIADIVAYLLQQNQFPAGSKPLADSAALLDSIKLVFAKPGSAPAGSTTVVPGSTTTPPESSVVHPESTTTHPGTTSVHPGSTTVRTASRGAPLQNWRLASLLKP